MFSRIYSAVLAVLQIEVIANAIFQSPYLGLGKWWVLFYVTVPIVGMSFNVHDEAEFLLETAVLMDPDNTRAHFDYVSALQKRQKFSEALEQARLLKAKDPEDPQLDMLYACGQLNTF